jgi:hypothetical protein
MPTTQTNGTALQDQLIDTIESAQTMVLDGVNLLSERVVNFKSEDLPDPKVAWASSFDFAEKVIESQRKFGMALLDAVTPPSSDSNPSS